MMDKKKEVWLVTGVAGFLGSHVAEALIAKGETVVGVDNLSWGKPQYLELFPKDHFTFEKGDIRDSSFMDQVFSKHRPSKVVHLAALHFIPAAIADPALAISINVHGTQVVLSAALKHSVEAIWYASTGDVYANSELPHKVGDATVPFNIYGLSKLMGEQLIFLGLKNHPSVKAVVGRLFNLYGVRETNPHILPEIFKQLHASKDFSLSLGNIWPKRDFVPVRDAANAVILTLQKAKPGITTVNVATGVSRSVEDMIEAMSTLLNRKISVSVDPERVRSVERANLQADVAPLKEMLSWTPSADLVHNMRELLISEKLLEA